ncbi:MAG: acyl-CoA reductase [Gemmatimonadota bacterium]
MNQSFDAWHLPGLLDNELTLATYQLGDLDVRAPVLTPDQLQRVIAHITNARMNTLQSTPVAAIVTAIDRAANRIAADETARTMLSAVTGYSPQIVEDILSHMTRDWSRGELEALLRAELADSRVLDAPIADQSGCARLAVGPRLAFHVFSGNVPGVSVTSIVRSLLVKAATLGKTASGEPVLAVLFARALAANSPALAEALAVTYWPGGTSDLEAVAISAADALVVYGGAETVNALRVRAGARVKLVEHGPKLSLGVVGRGASLATARAIGAATAAYDQQGCVSPHVVYVERGGVAGRALAEAIAAELAGLAVAMPRRRLSAAEAIAIRDARTRAEFSGDGNATTVVFGSNDTSYTVIYDEDVTLAASCLNRTLYVKPIDDCDALRTLLAPHRDVLQSVALAGFSSHEVARIATLLAEVGVTRITSFEQLPWPPMTWHHDGRGPLLELLNWQDIEL